MWPFSLLARQKSGETSGTANPAQWLIDWVRGGAATSSGAQVTAASAERQAAVFSCCQVLSQDVAKLPVVVYRKTGKGKSADYDHPVARLLRGQPNPRQTSYEFRALMEWNLALRGNAYAWIERNAEGAPLALWPLHPERVIVKESPNYAIFYEIRRRAQDAAITIRAEDMLHLKENSEDGIVGRSFATMLREAVGLAITAEQHTGRVFKNGAKVGGVLTTPSHFSEPAKQNLKDSFEKKFSDENAYKTAVLEEGVTFTQIGMDSHDAQLLEILKFSRSQIAGAKRMPPHKIGDLDRATFTNIEHQALEYTTDCLLAILANWEERLEAALLTEDERAAGYFIKFKVDGLLRGDIKSRYAAYAIGRNWGWLSPNEVREFEDMNPIEGGDEYLKPTNMIGLNESLDTMSAGEGDKGGAVDGVDRYLMDGVLRGLLPQALVSWKPNGKANGHA